MTTNSAMSTTETTVTTTADIMTTNMTMTTMNTTMLTSNSTVTTPACHFFCAENMGTAEYLFTALIVTLSILVLIGGACLFYIFYYLPRKDRQHRSTDTQEYRAALISTLAARVSEAEEMLREDHNVVDCAPRHASPSFGHLSRSRSAVAPECDCDSKPGHDKCHSCTPHKIVEPFLNPKENQPTLPVRSQPSSAVFENELSQSVRSEPLNSPALVCKAKKKKLDLLRRKKSKDGPRVKWGSVWPVFTLSARSPNTVIYQGSSVFDELDSMEEDEYSEMVDKGKKALKEDITQSSEGTGNKRSIASASQRQRQQLSNQAARVKRSLGTQSDGSLEEDGGDSKTLSVHESSSNA